MALLLIEGFEANSAGGGQSFSFGEMQSHYRSLPCMMNAAGNSRWGGACLLLNQDARDYYDYSCFITNPLHTTSRTMIAGFGFKVTGSPSLTTDFFRLYDGAYYGISYHSKPGIGLRLASGAGGTYEIAVGVYLADGSWSLLGTTSGAGIQLFNPAARQDSWKYIELKVVCGSTDGGSDGAVEVRVEETTVLSLSGVATRYRPQDLTDYFHLYYTCIGFANPGNGGTNVSWIDDIYVLDDTGGDNDHKTYLGKQHVSVALPTGNGDHNDWTPNWNSYDPPKTNWECVSEVYPYGDAYVSLDGGDANFGKRDDYAYAVPPRLSAVTAVQIETATYYENPPSPIPNYSFYFQAKHGTTESTGPVIVINNRGAPDYFEGAPGFYFLRCRTMDTDPYGNPWTLEILAATLFGVIYWSHT